jgi:hypothetical protein
LLERIGNHVEQGKRSSKVSKHLPN